MKDKTLQAALSAFANQIARDRKTLAGDAELAHAVQHVNEVVLQRNPFNGIRDMTAGDVLLGLADYLSDHTLWNVREYNKEVEQGKIRCVAFKGHSTIPDGTIIHRNMAWLVESWRKAGKVTAAYPPEFCPRKEEHK